MTFFWLAGCAFFPALDVLWEGGFFAFIEVGFTGLVEGGRLSETELEVSSSESLALFFWLVAVGIFSCVAATSVNRDSHMSKVRNRNQGLLERVANPGIV